MSDMPRSSANDRVSMKEVDAYQIKKSGASVAPVKGKAVQKTTAPTQKSTGNVPTGRSRLG